MADKEDLDWIESLKLTQLELQAYLSDLKSALNSLNSPEIKKGERKEGEFKYLELPVQLDNLLSTISGPISTTELTNLIMKDRPHDQKSWILTNRNISRLLNSRVHRGLVRKLGRVQGANRSVLWEWID